MTVPRPAKSLPPVHWRERDPASARSVRATAGPIGEPGRPAKGRRSAAALNRIIDWLAVESSRRYRATGRTTFCNVYACDVAYLAGAYLPRVWWTEAAIRRLRRGVAVAPRYAETILELNANALHDWLGEHGAAFGWSRASAPGELQACADRGGIAVICARRADPRRSGHVAVAAPEGALKARRDAAGRVLVPVLSQAGAVNYRRLVPQRRWWTEAKFSSVALFTHG
jgi:hypothetical protein